LTVAFFRLSLVLVILSPSLSFAVELDAARQQTLINMLKHDCGACHGLTLNGGLGPSLLPAALTGKTDEFLVMTVLEGRSGTAMPPWKRFMTKQEAQWLIRKIRTRN
jgi:cytochrome c55X